MYKYRLTRRGKIVVTAFTIVLFSVASTLSMGIMARAQDNKPYNQSSPDTGFEVVSFAHGDFHVENTDDTFNAANISAENTDVENSNESYSSSEGYYSHEGGKIAFLTFDDGPSKDITPQIMDVLKKYDIKATFFVLGSLCARNNTILEDIAKSGHAIGIHTYSHNYKVVYESPESFINEIYMTEAVFRQILGEEFHTRLFRFPGGSFEEYKKQYKDMLTANGYVSIDWNVITGDGESSNLPPEKLLDRLKATSKGKQSIIVLMHDASGKQTTVDALPSVIEYLKSQGYEFRTL